MTIIPTTTSPYQGALVNLAGRQIEIEIRYDQPADVWTFNLKEGDDYLLRGRRIVLGTDLLRAHALGLGSIVAVALTDPERDPGAGDIGERVLLVHQEPVA